MTDFIIISETFPRHHKIIIDEPWPRTTHQQRKFGNGRSYEPASLKAARKWWCAILRPYAPKEPIAGAVSISIGLWFKSRKRGYRTERPDCDNLAKLPIDCMMQLGWFADDAQVARLWVCKFNAPEDKVQIEVEEIGHGR